MADYYSTADVNVSNGTTSADFIVRRSGTSADIAAGGSLNFETWDVTAVAGTDYTATAGTLNFAAGVTEATITVAILPAAYDKGSKITFDLALVGYSKATGTIDPTATDNQAQTYVVVPQSNTLVAVPTSAAATDTTSNLYYQTVASGFSAPKSANVAMPMAYIRLGAGRTDMNDYERVIIADTNYVPYYKGKGATTGKPDEIGPLSGYTTPRGLAYPVGDQSDMAGNTHLDGIQMFSAKNYLLTVAADANTVINGNTVLSVKGTARELFGGSVRRWVKYSVASNVYRQVSGGEMIRGAPWSYEMTNSSKFSITTGKSVSYSLNYAFKGVTGAELTANMAAKYTISNSIAVTLKGLDMSATCDVLGNYSVNIPKMGVAKASAKFNKVVSDSITLSVAPLTVTPWMAAANAIATGTTAIAVVGGAAAAIPGWMAAFESDGKFYNDATADDLSKEYSRPFLDAGPYSVMSAAGLAAAAVVIAAVLQQKAQLLPGTFPKITMNQLGMTLECGTSSIVVSNVGISMTAPTINVAGEASVGIESTMGISLESPEIRHVADYANFTGGLFVYEDLEVGGDGEFVGTLRAAYVSA